MVGLMLDAGATSDEEDRNGLTPVAIAAKQGYFDILEEFAANTSNPVNLRYLGFVITNFSKMHKQVFSFVGTSAMQQD